MKRDCLYARNAPIIHIIYEYLKFCQSILITDFLLKAKLQKHDVLDLYRHYCIQNCCILSLDFIFLLVTWTRSVDMWSRIQAKLLRYWRV